MENNNQKDTEVKKNPFAEMEEEVLRFWQKAEIFKKSVEKKAPKGQYVFYDGPPFITGLPHYATLLPSIAKDMVPRYWTMKGYRVERVWGWDCHGLPAENKVENQLDLKNKKDIEGLGVDKFVCACRDYVTTGSEQWEWYIERIGRWVDMKNAYRTMDFKFMESVIWAFKRLYEKGLIYEGNRSSLHCPRCATPLSKFEITMDAGSYRDVSDESVVVKFKIKDSKFKGKGNLYALAWTTTPWTLPGNLALAVNSNIDYALVKVDENKFKDLGEEETPPNISSANIEYYIIAKDQYELMLGEYSPELVEIIKGKDLIGVSYEPLFDLKNEEINSNQNSYKIYNGDFVSTEEGTGIVHIAPNFGEDDFNLGQEQGLPMSDLMDEMGHYTDLAGDFRGLYFKKAGRKVMQDLGEKLFSSFPYTHSYPFCYRCGAPLIYKTQKAWYLRINKIRGKLLKHNEKINWIPEFFKEGRFKYNLENAPDWCLSRSRYWGSPLPVWRCGECGELKVFGSAREIEEASGQEVKDLHRPAIDEHFFKCAKCGAAMKRVKEVLDCWFESGSMPFAQFHYPFDRKKEFEKDMFPADFIIEYTGQLRGWFYYLHVLAAALFDDRAFKNVIVSGVLAGTDGRKMSKSYGNYPDPKNTLHKYGADALRMYFMNSAIMLGDDASLNEKDIQDSLRKNVLLLWNVVKFYKIFSGGYFPEYGSGGAASGSILDRWIISRLNKLVSEVTDSMERYDLPAATRPISVFIDDLSTWYIRRSRERFKSENESEKEQVVKTAGYVLLEASKVFAPAMPFIAEQIWQAVSGNDFKDKGKSVHLEEWPGKGPVEKDVLAGMAAARKITEAALAKRDEAGIKVRQPLSKIIIKGPETGALKDEYMELIKEETNIKEAVFEKGGQEIEVELDLEISDDLRKEGVKRELVRRINSLRKKFNLTIDDRISIYWEGSAETRKAIRDFYEDLLKSTLAEEIKEGIGDDAAGIKEFELSGEKITLGISKN